jgi:hypothetical protein
VFAKLDLANGFKLWRRFFATAAIILTFIAVESRADVLLNTFAAGNAAPGLDWVVYFSDETHGQALAVPFTTMSEVTVNSIVAAITGTGHVTVGIMSDASGKPSNTFLHSQLWIDPKANILLGELSWELGAGNYWLAAIPEIGFFGNWPGGLVATSTSWAFTYREFNNGNAWNPTGPADAPAARIEGVASSPSEVPEPTSLLLLSSGFGMIGLAAWRKRK